MRLFTKAIVATLLAMAPAVAFADNQPGDQPATNPNDSSEQTGTPEATAAPTPSNQLPPAKSDHDAAPPVPVPNVPGVTGNVVEQAGVGGSVGYGRGGVLELGGSAGLTIASNLRDINFSPSIGWFLVDNFELSGIMSVSNVKAGSESSTVWSALVEPSFHLPFNREMFGFVGMGVGAAYIDSLGAGLAVAPRIGMNFLVGRSGILTPSLSYEYTTHNTMSSTGPDGTTDVTLVAISSALRANIGYTVMW
jgi:hypothetical protein